jgi:hypothetical protein
MQLFWLIRNETRTRGDARMMILTVASKAAPHSFSQGRSLTTTYPEHSIIEDLLLDSGANSIVLFEILIKRSS